MEIEIWICKMNMEKKLKLVLKIYLEIYQQTDVKLFC